MSARADADDPRPVIGEPYDWAGAYLGANAGGAIPLHQGETFQAISGVIGPAYDLHPANREGSGLTFGALAGYNWQRGNWVYGVETELNFLDGRKAPSGTFLAPPAYWGMGSSSYTLRPYSGGNYFGDLRGRFGFALDRALYYVTAGVATGGWRGPSALTLNGGGPGNLFTSTETLSSRMKYVVGAGVEYALGANWSARAEYLFLDQSFGTQIFDNGSGFDYASQTRSDSHVLRFGLTYRIGQASVSGAAEGSEKKQAPAATDKKQAPEAKEKKQAPAAREKKQPPAAGEESQAPAAGANKNSQAAKAEGAQAASPNAAETTAGGKISTASESEKSNPTAPTDKGEAERYSFHGQATVLPQGYPEFGALYTGQNSLPPGGEVRATVSATGYFGLRLWEGGEAYVNPEIDEGYGLHSTFGVAGFTSAEAYKLGHARPYMRFQRFFMRQTIGLGGESETVDAGQNQLAGSADSNRLTFTVGKYSIVDIMDDNKYAHDGRNGFINWSIIDMGAFDYAGDAWSYTYGVTAEWKQDWWTARAGLYQLSLVPGSEYIEPRLGRQFSPVIELEARHKLLFDLQGKVKLLGYADIGFMGKYEDALELAFATGTIPDVTQVRKKRDKWGGGINIEQPITDDLGFFLRASMMNGRYEAFDFTDIDRSLSGGFVLGGAQWGRPKDAIGVAGVVNGLSGNAANYFAAGGLGLLIGDGALSYDGEHIFETYYKYNIAEGVHLTVDYQFVHNPAYNRDRGPVNVFALRLHGEF